VRHRILIGLVLTLGVLGVMLSAQTITEEARYGVPELEAMHEVIYPIWHTAYPQKDLAALRGFVPEIEKLARAVAEAKLPGILREAQDEWDKALPDFKKTVEAYTAAAAAPDGPALLSAAEALHSAYEMLNRVVRPQPREVMEFHEALYVVYHTHFPNKDYAAIRAAGAGLLTKAEAVVTAKLSKRFEPKKDAYQPAAAALLDSVKALLAVAPDNDEGLKQAVETMHGRYAELQKIFE